MQNLLWNMMPKLLLLLFTSGVSCTIFFFFCTIFKRLQETFSIAYFSPYVLLNYKMLKMDKSCI